MSRNPPLHLRPLAVALGALLHLVLFSLLALDVEGAFSLVLQLVLFKKLLAEIKGDERQQYAAESRGAVRNEKL